MFTANRYRFVLIIFFLGNAKVLRSFVAGGRRVEGVECTGVVPLAREPMELHVH